MDLKYVLFHGKYVPMTSKISMFQVGMTDPLKIYLNGIQPPTWGQYTPTPPSDPPLLHRVFTFIVGKQFRHICFSVPHSSFPFLPYSHTLLVPLSLFLSLPLLSLSLSLSVSLLLSNSSPIYLSLSLSFFPPFLSFHLRLFNL